MALLFIIIIIMAMGSSSGGTYEPVAKKSLGPLPEFSDQEKTVYDLANGQIPPEAKEILVYTYVTTRSEGEFKRGYYELFTAEGDKESRKEYKQYLNVACGQGMITVYSENMWFPMGEGKLYAKLVHPEGKKSIACKADEHKDWSEVFVIGYRA